MGETAVSQTSTILQKKEPHGFCRGGLGMSQKAMADVGLLVCGVEGAPLAIDQQQALLRLWNTLAMAAKSLVMELWAHRENN